MQGGCRASQHGDYSLTWKTVPGKTGINYILIFWEWWGKQRTFFFVDCSLSKMWALFLNGYVGLVLGRLSSSLFFYVFTKCVRN